jgi:hypothetical protein
MPFHLPLLHRLVEERAGERRFLFQLKVHAEASARDSHDRFISRQY